MRLVVHDAPCREHVEQDHPRMLKGDRLVDERHRKQHAGSSDEQEGQGGRHHGRQQNARGHQAGSYVDQELALIRGSIWHQHDRHARPYQGYHGGNDDARTQHERRRFP